MLSAEEKSKIKSEALRKWYQTPEGLALREKKRQRQRGNTYALGYKDTPEQRARKSDGQRKRKHDPSQWAKAAESRRGCFVPQEERDRIRAMNTGNRYHLGHRNTPEAIERMRDVHIGQLVSDETKEKQREAQIRHWRNPEYRDRIVKSILTALQIHPNKPETFVVKILDKIAPNAWKFVGDGQLIICGKNPDIANVNGRKALVLVHGVFWHLKKFQKENPELTKAQVERQDIEFYKTYGWHTLIVWEDELKHPEKVMAKLKEFTGTSDYTRSLT